MLVDVLILLVAAVLIVPGFQRFGLGSVLGYLTAGMLVGPSVLGLIGFVEEIRAIAELGVVFLLFIIGLELKPERLWTMRKLVFGLGIAQVAITGSVISAIAYALGLNPRPSIIIGFGLALSSTAFVLQLLAEHRILPHKEGRASFGVLLLQDLAVVPLLAMIQIFEPRTGGIGTDIGLGLLEGLGALALVIVAGRYAVRPIFRHIATNASHEIFTAMAVLLVLGTGWLMEETGLSMALGAFLAGVLLSDSEFRHQITADVEHFRGLLLGLFFMAVGMLIDLSLLVSRPWLLLGIVIALLLIKIAVFYPLARLFSLSHAQAFRSAFYLSQAGEFAFVLFGVAAGFNLLSAEQFNLLSLVVVISMISTPMMFLIAHKTVSREETAELPNELRAAHAKPTEGAVLVAGYGRFGQQITRVLQTRGVPYVAIDYNPATVLKAHEQGLPVYYGDATHSDMLRHLGCNEAKLAIVTMDHSHAVEKTVRAIREGAPDVPVFVRAHSEEDSRLLNKLGVNIIVPETLESSLQLAAEALRYLGTAEADIGETIKQFRDEDYSQLRGSSNPTK
ncbi:monovalent cation:proton antiporter-2 (CPA2) family protein [Kaarinaea lacus]